MRTVAALGRVIGMGRLWKSAGSASGFATPRQPAQARTIISSDDRMLRRAELLVEVESVMPQAPITLRSLEIYPEKLSAAGHNRGHLDT